jgi:hypothetical protein
MPPIYTINMPMVFYYVSSDALPLPATANMVLQSIYTASPDALPSNLGQKPLRPRPNAILPRLVEHQQAKTKRGGQEPVLDRNLAGIDGTLQRGDVAEDEDDDNGEQHSGENKPVLRALVEEWGLLEDAEAARAGCEEVEELPG